MNVKPEVISSIAGDKVIAASSVVTLDPRRRKFHRPVTVSVPLTSLPTSHHQDAASDLRLLCSLSGATCVCLILSLPLMLVNKDYHYHYHRNLIVSFVSDMPPFHRIL